MDGNGRWAKERGWIRLKGHEQGAASVQESLEGCLEAGVSYLTLYAFSSENWKRPQLEVQGLMALLERYLGERVEEMNRNGVRFRAIGRLSELSLPIRKRLEKATEATQQNSRLTLTLALNYGGRAEIVDALQAIAGEVAQGRISPEAISEEKISEHLYTAGMPDPDLLIRTSGEYRLSNFLLWQLSYSELYVTPKLWPDFKKADLLAAIADYQQRERRFGGAK